MDAVRAARQPQHRRGETIVMKYFGGSAAIPLLTTLVAACAGPPSSNAEYDRAAARDEIWSKEQAIFQGRSRGDLGVYMGFAAGDYMGWPPGSPAPLGIEQLRARAEQMRGKDQEEIAMEFGDITFSGNTAVIYYSTHKTRLPVGTPVDQTADIAHVWVREDDQWKLLGALGRYTSPGYDEAQARDEIWRREQAIYAARGNGDLQYYVDNASKHYMGWPPGWPKPSGIDQLRAGVELMRGLDQEELVMEFGDITFSGSAAVIYYSTHRTRMPTGEAVDQRFDIAHVWAREGDEWRLLGALGRNRAPTSNFAADSEN
ncbi:MAG: nuclear transport factor 2 family protein [Rhodospirillaceae bacterium]|nr:nuclear transport factor 2 family protein [Rhodospirillaceae bacterium]